MPTKLELNSPLAPPLPLHRFSIEQYHRLGETGVLTPDDKVELLEGWIVEKMNQRPIHAFIVGLISELLQDQLPAGLSIRCQLPITTQRSEPEPDIAIVVGSHTNFRNHHPHGSDCLLLIEVADTSLDKDRAKISIYKSAGVHNYWIVDISEKCLEQYSFLESTAAIQPTIYSTDSTISLHVGEAEINLDLRRLFG